MHNILVVDDEKDIRESLRGILEDEGYKVAVAESGEACLAQLKTAAPKWSFSIYGYPAWMDWRRWNRYANCSWKRCPRW